MTQTETDLLNGNFADNPEHESGATSSIGPTWPPKRGESFNRAKGFYTGGVIAHNPGPDVGGGGELSDSNGVIAHPGALSEFTGAFRQFITEMDTETTRVQFRAVMEGSLLRQLATDELFQHHVEAIIPLDPGELGTEPVIVYLGANAPSRQPTEDDLARIAVNVREAFSIERKTPEEMIRRAKENGYQINILSLPYTLVEREEIIDQMLALYERFKWNREDVKAILTNPNNIIAVARSEGRIVSAGVAELAKVPMGSSLLRIAEITEAATFKEHEGKGVYAGVSTTLLLELAERSKNKKIFGGELSVVFGECNAPSMGVLRVVRSQGRTFSMQIGEQYGFAGRGILWQQVPIGGAEHSGKYNDLLPAFLRRSNLYEYYANGRQTV